MLRAVGLSMWFAFLVVGVASAAEEPAPKSKVDSSTLHHKVLAGYQGWFRCPGDPAGGGWVHWSRNGRRITPESLTFEMWPEMAEYSAEEKYLAGDFTYPDGSPAHLFSSAHPKTVERHFRWMEEYGLDGVMLQRFLVSLRDPALNRVLGHVRDSAAKTGRVYGICYDMSGAPADRLYEMVTSDWKRLVDEQRVTADERYIKHNGKPVVMVWGFFSDRFSPEIANKILDFFASDPKYSATLIGGCQWPWRAEKNAEWAKVFRRFDVISPWNIGNYRTEGGKRYASTNVWKDDLAVVKQNDKQAYLPVVYPGFAWTNLKGKQSANQSLPRLGGEFYWRQFAAAGDLGIDMVYVAMFDEVDEGTAIFKVSNTPPTQAHFATLDGLPSDFYLRLTAEGAKVIRGEKKAETKLPIEP